MKLIIRGDDYGYTMVHNLGTIKAIEEGIVTHVDMMLDTPGTLDGMERIKAYPWISIGWHAHFWGTPVSDPKLIPSMVTPEGRFKFRKNQKLKETVVFEEALLECRAQVERCIRILGKAPDTTEFFGSSVLEMARKQVCDEYGIRYGFTTRYEVASGIQNPCLEKYRDLKIFMPNQLNTVYNPMNDKDWNQRRNYDPIRYFVEDQDQIMKNEISITAWHPGFLDDYVLESSFRDARPIDVAALCSPVLKQWVVDKQVELINLRDALNGTKEYQNHLKITANPLLLWK